MALNTMEEKRFGLKKESVRGTAEAAPDVWRAITADSELTYVRNLIDDETKRGIAAKFPAAAGVKVGTGTIKAPVRASDIGEFIQMCLGDPSSALESTSLGYAHTWTAPIAGNQKQAYTMFMDRGIGVKSYSLGQVTQLVFSGDNEGLAQMQATAGFKAEASSSIGSPVYTSELEELTSYQADVKLAGSSSLDVKSYSVNMNPNMLPLRTLNQSEDVRDFIARQLVVTGELEAYFSSETERDKFIAGTQSSFELVLTGSLIEDTTFETLNIVIPKIKYRAYPFGELDELLGAAVEFEAEYDTATSKLLDVIVKNKVSAY